MTPTRTLQEHPLILIFDDDLVHRPDFLAGMPARFVYRHDADQAEDDVAAHDPDLVFMDFAMGATRNGVDAVRALRVRWPDLAIVAISSDARMNRLMLEAGATVAAVKMALPEEFRVVVQYARRSP
jgi:DNA-binding NarL/FixJ family response regulator